MTYREGHWMVRVVRQGPEVCARIWRCWHEPGLPANRMDRCYWQGQLGLDLVDPAEIWAMLEFCEASPEEQRRLSNPPLSDRARRDGRKPAFVTAPLALWKQQRARRISAAEFAAQVEWLRWAERNSPTRPDLHYRRRTDLAAVPIPRFERSAP